ncbi:MAG: oligopeptide transporter, OPT family [Deltaproteobacteria bacterium]|nr:oligopeptide transporter, OPT family [Deltaproteobacteria bacterium]
MFFTIPASNMTVTQALQNLTCYVNNEGLTPLFHTKTQIFCLSMLGGGLGILLMIPLRKYLVDQEHGRLAFPEGTACAEIIIAGDEGGTKARLVFMGIAIGALYKALQNMLKLLPESVNYDFRGLMKGGTMGVDATPALLGVGYIIGPRISALMLSGAVLGYLGFAPLISFIGNQIPDIIISPGTIPISEMGSGELRNFYIKYLGVGAVAIGGFVSLIKSLPVIFSSFSKGLGQLLGKKAESETPARTDRDLPMKWVLIGVLSIIAAIWLLPNTELHLIGIIISVVFGFFFVVVAARIVGIVGSSSSPVSGMTIATLLVTCLVLVYLGISGVKGMVTAMSVGTIVCIAVCMSGDIAQDLKTGYLLGATPWKQQLTEFIGLLFPALAMGFTVFFLNDAFGFVQIEGSNRTPLLAPQANVMATLVQGVMNSSLPWLPIIVGGMVALSIELLGISSLPFAIGLYLPLSLSTPIMTGGLVSYFINRYAKKDNKKSKNENGILFSSGLVAGDALVSVLVAFMIGTWSSYELYYDAHDGMMATMTGSLGPWVSLVCFISLAAVLGHLAWHGSIKKK